MIGAIEAGGTKFVLAVADDKKQIVAREKIPTTSPEHVLEETIDFFKQYEIESLGIGSFGPIGVDPARSDYGYIKKTPKVGWSNFPLLLKLKNAFNIPIYWTTDVNVAAYGELQEGRGIGKKNLVYFTIGTGVGAGLILNKQIYTGYNHPEVGHLIMKPVVGDHFTGICPYHESCLEGMASGPAIEKRIGHSAKELTTADNEWQTEAFYLAQACVDVTVMFAPDIIIFGGGVSNQEQLFPKIRSSFLQQLGGYVDTPPVEDYIVHAALGDDAGIVGALLLADKARDSSVSLSYTE